MNLNEIIAIVLAFIAVTDSIMVRTVLPKIFAKEHATKEQRDVYAKILKIIDMMTYVFFIAAIAVYMFEPF